MRPESVDALADSCVVIDLLDPRSPFHAWARAALRWRPSGTIHLSPIVYAELFAGSQPPPEAIFAILQRADLPWEAAEMGGRAHGDYRRRGGPKDTILADFLIGAHAATNGWALITRDPRRIRTAFPGVRLITPDTDLL